VNAQDNLLTASVESTSSPIGIIAAGAAVAVLAVVVALYCRKRSHALRTKLSTEPVDLSQKGGGQCADARDVPVTVAPAPAATVPEPTPAAAPPAILSAPATKKAQPFVISLIITMYTNKID